MLVTKDFIVESIQRNADGVPVVRGSLTISKNSEDEVQAEEDVLSARLDGVGVRLRHVVYNPNGCKG